jgi:hypothetical protein
MDEIFAFDVCIRRLRRLEEEEDEDEEDEKEKCLAPLERLLALLLPVHLVGCIFDMITWTFNYYNKQSLHSNVNT